MEQRPVQSLHASWILLTPRKKKQLQIKKNHTNQNKIDENKSSDQTCQKNRRKDKKRTRKASGLGETLEKRNTEFTNKLGQLHMAQNGYIRSSA